jgi:ribosomal protein L20A (L18A)
MGHNPGGSLTMKYQIECMETNTFVVEVEAQNEDEARELAHADINSHKIIKEWVSDWEINLITEVN